MKISTAVHSKGGDRRHCYQVVPMCTSLEVSLVSKVTQYTTAAWASVSAWRLTVGHKNRHPVKSVSGSSKLLSFRAATCKDK